jgi:polygalacturonase
MTQRSSVQQALPLSSVRALAPNAQRRRLLLGSMGATGLALGEALWPTAALAEFEPGDPWRLAQAIIERLSVPLEFPKRDFVITAHGAKPCTLVQVQGWISKDEQGLLNTPAKDAPDCYAAIKAAIEACHAAGGGRVLIPAGNWHCAGPMVLLSNVHVHLEKGAQLYFSPNPSDYAKYGPHDCGANGKLVVSRWQSNDCLNFSPMVYAYGQNNIALTGEDWTSILNGQGGTPFNDEGHCWWSWKSDGPNKARRGAVMMEGLPNPANPHSLSALAPGLDPALQRLIQGEGDKWRTDNAFLPALSEAGVPTGQRVFGLGHYLRPCMIQLIDCTNVLLEGYQVNNAPFWQHHPVHCRNLVLRHVHANSMGANSDGFDPEACDTVLVEGCTFNTGDDCIAIKAGKNNDTQYGPTQNIVIQDCVMNSGHGGVTLGSEMAGGIQNVFAQNIECRNTFWATRPLYTAIRLKTNMNRGGYLRNFYVRNVTIPNGVQTTPSFYKPLPGSPIAPRSVATSGGAVITFDCDYMPSADGVRTRPPVVANVHIANVKVGNVAARDNHSCYQAFLVQGPVPASYNGAQPAPTVPPVMNVTLANCDFGRPAKADQPWYLYNVRRLKLENVTIDGKLYNTTLSA